MPRASDAKVWNLDLERALQCRRNDAVLTGSSRQTTWLRGEEAIRAVSGDIYQFGTLVPGQQWARTGRIVGLPDALSATVRAECEGIIRGQIPLIPSGMEVSDPQSAGFVEPKRDMSRHPYLLRMQERGGGYALLLAFHHHPKQNGSVHYRDELIRDAQPYCDEAMAPNFWAGRTTTAGWKSIDSLEKHRLVHRNSMNAARHHASYNRGPKDEFVLTRDGQDFIQAMLAKWPDATTKRYPSGSSPAFGGGRGRGRGGGRSGGRISAPGSVDPKAPSGVAQKDEGELREWVRTAGLPAHRSWRVSNARRKHLHRVCEQMRQQGYDIQTESAGQEGISRSIMVTLRARPAGQPGPAGAAAGRQEGAWGAHSSGGSGAPPGQGHRLGGSSTASRRRAHPASQALLAAERRLNSAASSRTHYTDAPPHVLRTGGSAAGQGGGASSVRAAAAAAAAANCPCGGECGGDPDTCEAIVISLSPSVQTPRRSVGDDGGGGGTVAASGSAVAAAAASAVPSCQCDGTCAGDPDMCEAIVASLRESRNSASSARAPSSAAGDADDVVCLGAAGQAPTVNGEDGVLRIIVDTRERTSDSAPRRLLDAVSLKLSEAKERNRMLQPLVHAEVERTSLSLADYAFVLPNADSEQQQVGSTLVERKTIRDIVGRSSHRQGCAHIEQLTRMAGLADARATRLLLLEGDLRQANSATVYDRSAADDQNVVDSLTALYDVAAGLFLRGGATIQLLHTKDPQVTARMLAQLTVVVAKMGRPLEPSCTLSAYNAQHTKARARIKRQAFHQQLENGLQAMACQDAEALALSTAVSARWHSWSALRVEFEQCDCPLQRQRLLCPLLGDKDGPKRWAKWVYEVCKSVEGLGSCSQNSPFDHSRQPHCRRVSVRGTKELVCELPESDGDKIVIREYIPCADGSGSSKPGSEWATIRVSDGVAVSHTFRVVLLQGNLLVSYLSAVFDSDLDDIDIAEQAAKMLCDDLEQSKQDLPSLEHCRELLLLEGVTRACNRQKSGRTTPISSRVNALCDLVILVLQHSSGLHVLNLSVAERDHERRRLPTVVMQALVLSAQAEALLYFPAYGARASGGAAAALAPASAAAVARRCSSVGAASATPQPGANATCNPGSRGSSRAANTDAGTSTTGRKRRWHSFGGAASAGANGRSPPAKRAATAAGAAAAAPGIAGELGATYESKEQHLWSTREQEQRQGHAAAGRRGRMLADNDDDNDGWSSDGYRSGTEEDEQPSPQLQSQPQQPPIAARSSSSSSTSAGSARRLMPDSLDRRFELLESSDEDESLLVHPFAEVVQSAAQSDAAAATSTDSSAEPGSVYITFTDSEPQDDDDVDSSNDGPVTIDLADSQSQDDWSD